MQGKTVCQGLSQGYQGISLAAEQNRLNKEWGKWDSTCIRVLSPMAIAVIEAGENDGLFKDRANATEPPFMAPSTDPTQYSKVFQCGVTCYSRLC